MTKVPDFHTSNDEDKPVYHFESECQYGKEIKRDGNAVYERGIGRLPCKECTRLANA
jgi:hypothetical protein